MHRVDMKNSLLVKIARKLGIWKPYPATDQVVCNVCGNDNTAVIANSVQFSMRYQTKGCKNCGLIYMSPRPPEEAYNHFYNELYPILYGVEEVSLVATERGRQVVDFTYSNIDPNEIRGVFDIGCGGVGVLDAFYEKDCELKKSDSAYYGCDPIFTGKENIHERYNISKQFVEQVPTEDFSKCNIFISYDNIEHLTDPKRVMKFLHENSSENSYVFISTSCLDHWDDIPKSKSVKNNFENYYLRFAHTFTFSRQTLKNLMLSAGWECMKVQRAAKGDQWALFSKVDMQTPVFDSKHLDVELDFIDKYKNRPL